MLEEKDSCFPVLRQRVRQIPKKFIITFMIFFSFLKLIIFPFFFFSFTFLCCFQFIFIIYWLSFLIIKLSLRGIHVLNYAHCVLTVIWIIYYFVSSIYFHVFCFFLNSVQFFVILTYFLFSVLNLIFLWWKTILNIDEY